jgi:site-specific DNA-methyltransferase (cytosine-N4-specific)
MQCKKNGIDIHPARFPAALPAFFTRLLTDEDDIVLDPFAGSNTTGSVAEKLRRRWIAIDTVEEYLQASIYRFDSVSLTEHPAKATSTSSKATV